MKESITVEANISSDNFVKFALYDTFVMRKRWRTPALFAAIMGGFSLLCFTLLRNREQSSLLGLVLLSVGLVLPTVWVLMFIVSARAQARSSKLTPYKAQYTVTFSENGFEVVKDKEHAKFTYGDIKRLVRRRDCVYIYVDAGRAFLLPDSAEQRAALERFGLTPA